MTHSSEISADIQAPAWAHHAVWYQIFPDAFCNGDPDNNPTLEDVGRAWPHNSEPPWQLHPWTSDWYERQPWEQDSRDFKFHIQRRRYGGDLQGIINKLSYLEDLGVNALYLNPIFDAPSRHKYDGSCYHHIDPTLGPDPAGDRLLVQQETFADPDTWVWTAADRLLLQLVEEVHQRGMHIILDGVFNHMGIYSPPFQDVIKHGQKSPYASWFSIKDWEHDSKTGYPFHYHGWCGVAELPELKQDENGIVAGPREYIFASTRRWMDPNGNGTPAGGIDGWRLDVAYCIRHPFWKAWRKLVKGINPEAYLTAEIIDTPEAVRPYVAGDEFDAVMNYNFAFACDEFFVSDKTAVPASELDQRLNALREAAPPAFVGVQQNLFGSHDTARLATHLVNSDRLHYRDWDHYHPHSHVSRDYRPIKPGPEEIQRHKLLVIFQMTYLGAPMIYYGDEAGMWGPNDPCCRKPMLWPELEYDDEIFLPDGSKREEPDGVCFNEDLFHHYRKLIRIRQSCPALRIGDYRTIQTDDAHKLFVFERSCEAQRITVIINRSDTTQKLDLTLDPCHDVLNPDQPPPEPGQPVTVPGLWARILVRD